MSRDRSKIHANASRHSALSYGHAEKIEAQLVAEVQQMLERAKRPIEAAYPKVWFCPLTTEFFQCFLPYPARHRFHI